MSIVSYMSSNYRPDIDGLRAVAVVAVVLYHGGFSAFSGGFVGVDVFFVISGYLITSLILPEIESSSFRLAEFYERRIRRLFPALYFILIVSAVPAYFLLMPHELEDFGQSLATTAAFSSNFLFFTESGYFDGPSELKPLLHTWSLAIEEQYYLLFPAFLILLHRIAAKHLIKGVVLLLVLSLGVSIWSASQAPAAGFFLLPGRTWELMLGSLLAMGVIPGTALRSVNETLSTAGLAMVLLSVFTFDNLTPFPGYAALLPTLGTALIIYAGKSSKPGVSRLLSLRGVVFTGLISYSLYLWHWPLFVYAKHYLVRDLAIWEACGLVALSVALATLSWRFIERPYRGRSGWLSRRHLFTTSAAMTALIIAIGLYYDASEGLPARLPSDVSRIADVAFDKPTDRQDCEGIKADKLTYESLCRLNGQKLAPTFIVWGDSHAGTFLEAIAEISQDRNLNGLNATFNACVPFANTRSLPRDAEGECPAVHAKVLAIVEEHPEIETIILSAKWSRYAHGTTFQDQSTQVTTLQVDNRSANGLLENNILFSQAWFTTLEVLSDLNRKVFVIGPIPEIGVDVPNVLAKAALRGQTKKIDVPRAEFDRRNTLVMDLFEDAEAKGVIRYLPIHSTVCDVEVCRSTDEFGPLYFDGNHFSNRGASKAKDILENIFSETSD